MSEFEDDRENELLGELPEPLRIERGENTGYRKTGSRYSGFGQDGLYGRPYTGDNPPLDVGQQNQILSQPGNIGSVPLGYDVTSTFDARPVNARDFTTTIKLEFEFGACANALTEEGFFEVPNGYVAIIRGFRYNTDPITNIIPSENLIVTLIGDNVAAQNYTDIPMPLSQPDLFPCYILAGPQKNIGVRITHPLPPAFLTQMLTITIDVQLYGNLLLAKGLPIQYEPSNRVVGDPIL